MPKFIVSNSMHLEGSVSIGGSKNSALPILAATLLASGNSTIYEVPDLSDIQNMTSLLSCLGASVTKTDNKGITVCCKKPLPDVSSYELVSKLRASFLVTGPLLARCGRVKISMPGGCKIGSRPVDLHLKGLQAMGAKITQGHGIIEARCKKLTGTKIYLDFPSVGATENLIMAASLADGQTIIENAAVEPEIVDLTNFINLMGGKIVGAGTGTIKITGVEELSGQTHTVIPDRIEAGTYAAVAAITKGKIRIENVIPDHLKPITAKMREAGVTVTEGDNYIIVDATEKPKATDIKTLPYPGFPTDMQAPYSSFMTVAERTSVIIETIFENRFLHVPELVRMGAHVKIEGRTAVIEGSKKLTGAQVKATDLRAGAALVLAALAADGDTEISEIEHIERGYCNMDKKLTSLGANITRTE
ncbi:MAG: UDP-N-acetylglucosamine 1-carboxyvinyltransferase 1 [Firmicutes bacterium ADurb.Bin193]|nr:MAG: UDP-N-acetylglucosamine 1-carboxyvinyltransferase 1 [Firmicutes bacterium ADurb.Bin193]